jgi:hypothetical protein
MSSLKQVCVWELPFPPVGVFVYANGSPNVVYTTSCGNSIHDNLTLINLMNVNPNPAIDVVFVNLSVADNCILEITDIAGIRIYYNTSYCNNDEIHLNTFNKGVYLLRVQNGAETFISKLLIQ